MKRYVKRYEGNRAIHNAMKGAIIVQKAFGWGKCAPCRNSAGRFITDKQREVKKELVKIYN